MATADKHTIVETNSIFFNWLWASGKTNLAQPLNHNKIPAFLCFRCVCECAIHFIYRSPWKERKGLSFHPPSWRPTAKQTDPCRLFMPKQEGEASLLQEPFTASFVQCQHQKEVWIINTSGAARYVSGDITLRLFLWWGAVGETHARPTIQQQRLHEIYSGEGWWRGRFVQSKTCLQGSVDDLDFSSCSFASYCVGAKKLIKHKVNQLWVSARRAEM